MADFIARMALGSIWALIWHFGIIVGIIICALAVAWFSPIGKKLALAVAIMATVILLTAGIYTKLGADYVQAKWNAAQQADQRAAASAAAQAEASVAPLVPGERHAPRLRGDKFERNN
jgi:hypothetical protein